MIGCNVDSLMKVALRKSRASPFIPLQIISYYLNNSKNGYFSKVILFSNVKNLKNNYHENLSS
jgi:hypothetical protein